jgi:hypothetical protein
MLIEHRVGRPGGVVVVSFEASPLESSASWSLDLDLTIQLGHEPEQEN